MPSRIDSWSQGDGQGEKRRFSIRRRRPWRREERRRFLIQRRQGMGGAGAGGLPLVDLGLTLTAAMGRAAEVASCPPDAVLLLPRIEQWTVRCPCCLEYFGYFLFPWFQPRIWFTFFFCAALGSICRHKCEHQTGWPTFRVTPLQSAAWSISCFHCYYFFASKPHMHSGWLTESNAIDFFCPLSTNLRNFVWLAGKASRQVQWSVQREQPCSYWFSAERTQHQFAKKRTQHQSCNDSAAAAVDSMQRESITTSDRRRCRCGSADDQPPAKQTPAKDQPHQVQRSPNWHATQQKLIRPWERCKLVCNNKTLFDHWTGARVRSVRWILLKWRLPAPYRHIRDVNFYNKNCSLVPRCRGIPKWPLNLIHLMSSGASATILWERILLGTKNSNGEAPLFVSKMLIYCPTSNNYNDNPMIPCYGQLHFKR